MKPHIPPPSDEALSFRAAELFFNPKLSTSRIADILNNEFPSLQTKVTRESVYSLVSKAKAYGYIRLVPPLAQTLAKDVAAKFNCPSDYIQVADCPSNGSIEHVSSVAAQEALRLVQIVHDATGEPVRLGLGPGRATLDFVHALSPMLLDDPSLPKLKLVSISAGGPAYHPDYSANSFFPLFPQTSVVEKIGLFAENLVPSKSMKRIRDLPGCREAFAVAKDIRVIVTSMGDTGDPHALLRLWYEQCVEPKPSWWDEAVADVQYRPLAQDRFLKDQPNDMRAVTLFELEDMVKLAQAKDRHVILIARQCGACEPRRTKARALLPILKHPEMRVFSRLILDSPTAYELLQL